MRTHVINCVLRTAVVQLLGIDAKSGVCYGVMQTDCLHASLLTDLDFKNIFLVSLEVKFCGIMSVCVCGGGGGPSQIIYEPVD
jgi:hypothetical protein